jgi:hypothetical protein
VRYAEMLEGTADLPDASGAIAPEALDAMSAEQRARLERLRRELVVGSDGSA